MAFQAIKAGASWPGIEKGNVVKCLYCNSRARWCYGYLIGQTRYVCGTCLALTEASLWHELARRWLMHRLEDWCDDVAGFLEEDHRARSLAHSYPVRVDRRGRRRSG